MQFSLIPAHVTLCREDELEGLDAATLNRRLSASQANPITLRFGAPASFGTHGILLPCVAGEPGFQGLRRSILGSGTVRRQAPHLTLAHPRNPRSSGNSLANAATLDAGTQIMFSAVSRITQAADSPWREVERVELPVAEDSDA